jgi:PAS domain S-box-containing protein
MRSESNTRLLLLLRTCVSAVSLTVVSIGLIVMSGWLLHIPSFKSFLPNLPAMRFNTALTLLLLGGSLWLMKNEETSPLQKHLGRALAGLVLLLSLLTSSQFLFGWNLGIDEFFVKDLDTPPDLYPGRIGPLALLCTSLSSIALLGLGSRISRYLAYIVAALASLIILNNLFGFQLAFNELIPNYIPVHTGLAFLVIALAIMAARPAHELIEVLSSDLPGTRAMRSLLLWIVTFTIVFALLVERGEDMGILDSNSESLVLVILLIFAYSPLIYFIARDINRNQAKLLLSDQILERVNVLVLVADAQGSISYVSPSVKTMLGFEPAELLGDGWWRVTYRFPAQGKAEKERLRLNVSQAELGSTEPHEREIQDRWGNTHWIMWVDAPGLDSSIIRVGHDVTERKRAEQELMVNETRYRQAIMAADAIPYSLDYSTNQYTFIGSRIAEITGYTPDELTPALLDSLIVESVMQGGFKGISMRKAVEMVRQGESGILWQCDHRIHIRSGEERWISDASIQILDDNEDIPKGSVGIFQDITERKRSEQALRQSEEKYRELSAELEQRVLERTADLKRVNIELEKAARIKDEFMAVMSHELRTPLNSILGLSESLLEQVYGTLTEQQRKSLRIIETSGEHLLELINDILDLSKVEAGKLELHPEPVEILQICEASLAFVKEQAAKKSIVLEFQPQHARHIIVADARYLKQILVNLLTNAVKFTPANGSVTLEVTAHAREGLIQFSVSDTGIGITPENLSRLFQPFVQVDSRLNRQFDGTGLGLALVQRLTDLHGGSVEVASEVGRGSRFTINLPWQPDAISQQVSIEEKTEFSVNAQVEQSGSASSTTPVHGIILLTEDNLANILTMSDYLEGKNFKVVVAHNGLEAVSLASEINPNIILMDIQMPGMDGLEAIRRLRADSRFRSVPILALTALAMPGDRELCLKAGATEYLSKPASLQKLIKMIYSLTGQSEDESIDPARL